MTRTKKKAPEQIRLLPQTRPKLERIARTRRWKLNAAVDALCDDFLSREDSEPSEDQDTPNQAGK